VVADIAAGEVLRLLADCDSSGALELEGVPGGAFCLDAGVVTAVRTTAVPDLTARLGALVDEPDDEERAALARSVIVDATVALLADPSPVPPRFRSPDDHGSGNLEGNPGGDSDGDPEAADGRRPVPTRTTTRVRIEVGDLLAAAAQGLDRLARAGVGPDDMVTLRPVPGRRGVRIDPIGWRLLGGLDRPTTPRDLAWRLGLPLVDTVCAVAALVDDEACDVHPRAAGRAPAPSRSGARPAARPGRNPPLVPEPPQPVSDRSQPLPDLPRRAGGDRQGPQHRAAPIAPDRDVLVRLIEGLRRL
jgi:hypothetical protein